MRHLLVWSFAVTTLLALPTPALACINTMHRHFEDRPVVRLTPQQVAWTKIREGDLEGASARLADAYPQLNPLRVGAEHVPGMRAEKRNALHAVAVTHVRSTRNTHWATQILDALARLKVKDARAHLAEAYALSEDEKMRDRGWAMLERMNRNRELSDPYTLTLLAVIRIQAGDVTGGRRAFAAAQNQKHHSGLGETVCCTVGEPALRHGFGGLGLGVVGTIGKGVAEK